MRTSRKILLTGSTGFIGKRLEIMLREQGNDIVALSRHGRGGSIAFPIESQADWSSLLKGVDCVIHTAARVHVMNDHVQEPLPLYRALNVAGTENMARQAAKMGVRRFIFLSSVKVNGEGSDSLGRPLTEEDAPSPEDPYGVSKHEAESILRTLSRDSGMETVIIRPPLVYGPGVKANFYLLMKWISMGLPVPSGEISNKRSFVGLSNLSSFVVECIHNELAANETFFVSDGIDLSTTELFKMLSMAFHSSPRHFPFPMRLLKQIGLLLGKKELVDRIFGSFQVDISKANRILGWRPPFTMEEELAATVEQFNLELGQTRYTSSKNGYSGIPRR